MHKSRLPIIAAMIAALPAYATDHTDTAPVVSATPIVEGVREPRQECTPEAPQTGRSVIAPIIGGVAGALLGSTVGRGSGRDAAAAAGAMAGDRIDNRSTAAAPPAERCRTVETARDIIRGHTVVYRYNGRDITTTMPYDPGPTLRVGIATLDADYAAPAPTAAMMGGNAPDVRAPVARRGALAADLRTPQPDYRYRY